MYRAGDVFLWNCERPDRVHPGGLVRATRGSTADNDSLAVRYVDPPEGAWGMTFYLFPGDMSSASQVFPILGEPDFSRLREEQP